MKKLILALFAAALLLVSCNRHHRTVSEQLLDNYALVTISVPDLSRFTDNGQEILDLYRQAANQADAIYWLQNFGYGKEFFSALPDPAEKAFAEVNYGPWNRIDNQPFVGGYGPKPVGARFYPEDMTDQEFDALDNPDKYSPYTIIVRAPDGSLKVEWYHEAYAGQVRKISDFLRAAADLTIQPGVRDYLLKKADAVLTDDYYQSDRAWLELNDSKIDLVIGPYETLDDDRYGLKASYGAYILLKNMERTAILKQLCARLPELQASLPGDPSYLSFVPGTESNIIACDVLYFGGYTNAGHKVLAANLPHDATLQKEVGSRTILFDNIIREKFNRTVFPVGTSLFEPDNQAHVDASAFYWIIVFRDVAQGLGVKETVNGKGTVSAALGSEALTIERAKDNVLGTLLCLRDVEANRIDALIMKRDVVTTFVANILRSTRFGSADASGRATLLIYNYLTEQGAIHRKASGKYGIDQDKVEAALTSLGAELLRIQATGDAKAARQLAEKYVVTPSAVKADIVNYELDKIPVDIRVAYEK